jgi:threonine synthase
MDITCVNCGRTYPKNGLPYICSYCGGLYDFPKPFPLNPVRVDPSQPGIWRYGHTFGFSKDIEPVTLGEGNTPFVWTRLFGRNIAIKCEYLNPSGSFKDRGSAVIVSWLKSRNIKEIVEDSSGNAGASLSEYAARVGIKARIYVPESASGPKLRQIKAYGADLISVPGSRENASEQAKIAVVAGRIYASHAYLPFNLPGYATISYEIFEQLGNKMPGAVILPVGQGGLLLGMSRGLDALRIAYATSEKTMIIGVQARACAPIWAQYVKNRNGEVTATNAPTVAEGVRVANPLRSDAVLQAVAASNGEIYAAEENEIIPRRDTLARSGFYVEPTSAIVLSALERNIKNLPDPVVVILTGSGLKFEN